MRMLELQQLWQQQAGKNGDVIPAPSTGIGGFTFPTIPSQQPPATPKTPAGLISTVGNRR